MKSTICTIFVIALLVVFRGTLLGDETGLHVSVKDGLVSISSAQSKLSEILARLSGELDMKINAKGTQENRVVSCEIEGVGIAEALQKLVPEWNSLIFSREERSIMIGIKGREESEPSQSETGMPTDAAGNVSDPSSTSGEGDLQGEAAAPSSEYEQSDSTPTETDGEENRDEVVDAASPPDELNGEDEAANDDPPPAEGKSRSRQRGPLSPW